MDELKPCPFCGKPAKKYGTNVVGCIDQSVCCASVDWGHYTSPEGPEISWNARAADARIAELERERDELRREHTVRGDYIEHMKDDQAALQARADRLAALLKEAGEKIAKQTDVSDAEWVGKLRPQHLVRMLALANAEARALLARLD